MFSTSRLQSLWLLLATWAAAALAPPAALAQSDIEVPQVTRTFAIENARVVQAPGRVIERGTVVVRDGLIEAVGAGVPIPFDAERIAGDSLTVYAGFIDGLSHAGIPQEAEEEQEDVEDPGNPPPDRAGIQPGRQARALLDPSQSSVEALRNAGFAAAHVVPRGELLPGQGAVVQLAGEAPAEMLLVPQASLFMQFKGARGGYPNVVYPSTPMAVIATIRQLYREAARRGEVLAAYESDPSGLERPPTDPIHEAFVPLTTGEQTAFFQADGALEIFRALELQRELGFPMALAGVGQAHRALDALQEADVKLFLTLDLPEEPKAKRDTVAADTITASGAPADTVTTASDTTKGVTPEDPGSFFVRDFRVRSYEDAEAEEENLRARQAIARQDYLTAAARLHEAGLRFGFTTLEAKPQDLRKNLRLMIESGLPEEAALAALTTNAASLLGLSNRLGTVDEGKIANLVVTAGPYFEEESEVRYVFVDGRKFEAEAPATDADAEGAANPAGTWSYTVETPQGAISGTLTITGTPGNLSGTITGAGQDEARLENLELDGAQLSFAFDAGEFGRVTADVTLDGDDLDGTLTTSDGESVPVTGTRTSGPDRR